MNSYTFLDPEYLLHIPLLTSLPLLWCAPCSLPLPQEASLETWASWLEGVVDTALAPHTDTPSYTAGRRILHNKTRTESVCHCLELLLSLLNVCLMDPAFLI